MNRNEAIAEGRKHYNGWPCEICGNNIKCVSNKTCHTCNERRRAECKYRKSAKTDRTEEQKRIRREFMQKAADKRRKEHAEGKNLRSRIVDWKEAMQNVNYS